MGTGRCRLLKKKWGEAAPPFSLSHFTWIPLLRHAQKKLTHPWLGLVPAKYAGKVPSMITESIFQKWKFKFSNPLYHGLEISHNPCALAADSLLHSQTPDSAEWDG